jgi:hypothetical protein
MPLEAYNLKLQSCRFMHGYSVENGLISVSLMENQHICETIFLSSIFPLTLLSVATKDANHD